MSELQDFYSLSPERVLEAVEHSGHRTTGLCQALNSLENRVYDVELEDRSHLVGKFYRPGRWSHDTIKDEHRLLAALEEHEIPVCSPVTLANGDTLQSTEEGILFALFPRIGGRAPDELGPKQLEELGRLLGQMHNIAGGTALKHRPTLSPATYGSACLEVILKQATLSPGARERYGSAVRELVDMAEARFSSVSSQAIHADFHRGNLLYDARRGWLMLDFDDMAQGPPVQDLWLILPSRPADCPGELAALLRGYELFRKFEHDSLRLIEALRGLRYVRYAAWLTARWQDPAFPRAFPHYGTDNYWEGQITDIYEQLRILQQENQAPTWS